MHDVPINPKHKNQVVFQRDTAHISECLSFTSFTASSNDRFAICLSVFCVGVCLPVLPDTSVATTADADSDLTSHLISLDVAGMM